MVETKTPLKEEKSKEEPTVTISKSAFEDLQKAMQQLKKDNNLLMAVTDKKALAHYYSRNRESLPSIVKLRIIDSKLVVGWRTIKNEIYQIAGTQKWVENQIIELLFDNGSKKEMPYIDFVRNYEYIFAKVINSTIDEISKELSIKVAREDNGKELTIGVKFVN